MKVLIIEDELAAARRLQELVREAEPGVEIAAVIDTVESAVSWFRNFGCPDLVFMDIQLADGLSFEIFSQIDVVCPVIFTTAYDQYMLDAFKVHSIDYLLKPVDPEELSGAIEKYRRFYQGETRAPDLQPFVDAIRQAQRYRKRFLVKRGQQLIHVPVEEVAYFHSEDGVTFLMHRDGRRHALDLTLEELEQIVDPSAFFRVNRAFLVRPEAIGTIHTYFNQRLKIALRPDSGAEVIVSRHRVKEFKDWLGG